MKFRHEYKHKVNLSDILQLRTRLNAVMEHDSNANSDGTYFIKSLYFDNYMDKALCEKLNGVNNREKFRIRYYNTDTSFIRLEKKSKINGLCSKESVAITADECQKIIDGDIGFMLDSGIPFLQELYAKMRYQLLRPKCIVAYRRESFVYLPGNVRVTIDMDICGSYNVQNFLNPDLSYLQLYHTHILEVKWDEFLPQIIRDIVQMKNRNTSAFSKYAAVRF
ncbi:MAG: polyphosphate polymerase domain-containing protein [Clostridia bacterium]|nr:polyphosphate polymerase domain-containing protein [Clostridia bacterium]